MRAPAASWCTSPCSECRPPAAGWQLVWPAAGPAAPTAPAWRPTLCALCRYEREGRQRKTIKAQALWFAILEAQVETGNPFMLYKDSANRKSNQQNLGTIKSSNLCTGALDRGICCTARWAGRVPLVLGSAAPALHLTSSAQLVGNPKHCSYTVSPTISHSKPPSLKPLASCAHPPQRSSSTPPPTRLPCATWPPSRCRGLCGRTSPAAARARSSSAPWMPPAGGAGMQVGGRWASMWLVQPAPASRRRVVVLKTRGEHVAIGLPGPCCLGLGCMSASWAACGVMGQCPLPPPPRYFDFEKLAEVTTVVTRNLNKIIDINYYPGEGEEGGRGGWQGGLESELGVHCTTDEVEAVREKLWHSCGPQAHRWAASPTLLHCGLTALLPPSPAAPAVETARRSNMRHRPIGLGVQGLADTFILLGMPFDSPEAKELNKAIFETIYYAALRTSMQLAKLEGARFCPVSRRVVWACAGRWPLGLPHSVGCWRPAVPLAAPGSPALMCSSRQPSASASALSLGVHPAMLPTNIPALTPSHPQAPTRRTRAPP